MTLSAAEDIVGLYQRHAKAWVAARSGRFVERAWLQRLMQFSPKGRVLDLGCGSGSPLASYLIGTGCAVTGVDSSPQMIELCRTRWPGGDWLVQDMRALSLPTLFDAILAWDSFFHLTPDHQKSMFEIFQAHAARGATLMFTSGNSHGEAIGILEGEPLYHASLDPSDYREGLVQHGFEVVDHVVEDPACDGRTIWLARRR